MSSSIYITALESEISNLQVEVDKLKSGLPFVDLSYIDAKTRIIKGLFSLINEQFVGRLQAK